MIDRTLNRPSAGYTTASQRSSNTLGSQSKKPLMEMSDLTQLIEPAEKLILQYPAVALASAFLVGVALACWIKRR
jgi:hypothetical protein